MTRLPRGLPISQTGCVLRTAWLAMLLSGCASEPSQITARSEDAIRDPAAMMRIAEAAERGGDVNSAETFYRRAAELAPDLAAAQIGDARVLAARGDLDQALERSKLAHARSPNDPEIASTLGRLLVANNDPGAALAVFDEASRAAPRSSSLLVGRGVALDALNRHFEAQEAYRAALIINPSSEPARRDLALSQTLSKTTDVRHPPVGISKSADIEDHS